LFQFYLFCVVTNLTDGVDSGADAYTVVLFVQLKLKIRTQHFICNRLLNSLDDCWFNKCWYFGGAQLVPTCNWCMPTM